MRISVKNREHELEMDWSVDAWAVQMKVVKHNQCRICAVPYQRTLQFWLSINATGWWNIKGCLVDHKGQGNFAFIFRCYCSPDWIPVLRLLRMHPTSYCLLFAGKREIGGKSSWPQPLLESARVTLLRAFNTWAAAGTRLLGALRDWNVILLCSWLVSPLPLAWC